MRQDENIRDAMFLHGAVVSPAPSGHQPRLGFYWHPPAPDHSNQGPRGVFRPCHQGAQESPVSAPETQVGATLLALT